MIEKICARLEEEKQRLRKMRNTCIALSDKEVCDIEEKAYNFCKEIVQEVAKEYGNGWIPVEVALPKEATTYEVTCEIVICSEKQYITTYALWGTEGEWICRKNELVIAWKEKSAPYQKGEQYEHK